MIGLRFVTLLGAVLMASAMPATAQTAPAASCPAWLNHSLPRLQDDAPQALCQFAGKVVLVVNTASHCGFTLQYDALEKLSADYAARGLVVLGFPSNDFGAQEPGSNAQIAAFCHNTFKVKFPMFAKSSVKGAASNPVFAHLAKVSGQTPSWNFHKYLVSRDGMVVRSFGSAVAPDSAGFKAELERLLALPVKAVKS